VQNCDADQARTSGGSFADRQVQFATDSEAGNNPAQPLPADEIRCRTVRLANRLVELLRQDIERFESAETGSAEGRVKAVTAFAKTIQFLEELITKMDAATDGSSQYPQDPLEFHRKLEKQLEVLAHGAATPGIPEGPAPG
jgi:hypothetical protein